MANYIAKGRQVVIPLTNKSGNAVEYGDVVVCDTGTAESFDVTTTTGYSDSFIGVVVDQDGIAVDAVGRICLCGYVAQVNLDGAASIGDFLFTDTVAEQGTPAAARAEGAFGQALTASATPAAIIWGVPDGAAGAGGDVATDTIWDAAGDIVQGTGANTASRLAIGTAYQLLRVNSGATALEYVSAGRVLINEATPTNTTVTWNSISNIYKTLEVEYVARSDRANVLDYFAVYFNNDTTVTNYRFMYMSAEGGNSHIAAGGDEPYFDYIAGGNATAGSCGSGHFKIINYASTTFRKQIHGQYSLHADTSSYYEKIAFTGAEWENTSAITRIDIINGSGSNFVAGSTFRLYGVF